MYLHSQAGPKWIMFAMRSSIHPVSIYYNGDHLYYDFKSFSLRHVNTSNMGDMIRILHEKLNELIEELFV